MKKVLFGYLFIFYCLCATSQFIHYVHCSHPSTYYYRPSFNSFRFMDGPASVRKLQESHSYSFNVSLPSPDYPGFAEYTFEMDSETFLPDERTIDMTFIYRECAPKFACQHLHNPNVTLTVTPQYYDPFMTHPSNNYTSPTEFRFNQTLPPTAVFNKHLHNMKVDQHYYLTVRFPMLTVRSQQDVDNAALIYIAYDIKLEWDTGAPAWIIALIVVGSILLAALLILAVVFVYRRMYAPQQADGYVPIDNQ
mmetsp:Transcript_15940/g.23826  ORF Transcript_15940/g.23826 Transcript_15940/m.23826 type:complete len:250 (+) Transcript_15940:28-777(+)